MDKNLQLKMKNRKPTVKLPFLNCSKGTCLLFNLLYEASIFSYTIQKSSTVYGQATGLQHPIPSFQLTTLLL
jgi:hypothetical protein